MSCASGRSPWRGLPCRARRAADIMLAGGAEAPLAPLTFAAFSIIRAMSTRNDDPARASRPFDASRDGFVMGEGAAVLVLEERSRAIARGARIYAEIVGHAYTNDAYHMTAPRPDGRQAARAIQLALADGDVARPTSATSRARLVHAAQRSDGRRRRSSRHSAITPTVDGERTRATTATHSARAAPSRRRSARSRCPAAGSRHHQPRTPRSTMRPRLPAGRGWGGGGPPLLRPSFSNSFGLGNQRRVGVAA